MWSLDARGISPHWAWLALLVCACGSANPTPTGPVTLASAKQVVDKYCVTCHSANGAASDFDWTDEHALLAHRRGIAAKVGRHSMPPPGVPQPDEAQRRVLLCWALSNAPECSK